MRRLGDGQCRAPCRRSMRRQPRQRLPAAPAKSLTGAAGGQAPRGGEGGLLGQNGGHGDQFGVEWRCVAAPLAFQVRNVERRNLRCVHTHGHGPPHTH
eukprot:365994-Chlamydomonas_euryale.AAC.8